MEWDTNWMRKALRSTGGEVIKMNKVIEKILTDQKARDPKTVEKLTFSNGQVGMPWTAPDAE